MDIEEAFVEISDTSNMKCAHCGEQVDKHFMLLGGVITCMNCADNPRDTLYKNERLHELESELTKRSGFTKAEVVVLSVLCLLIGFGVGLTVCGF